VIAAALIALSLSLAVAAPRVTVDLLGKQAPRAALVRGGGVARTLAARGDGLVVDGRPVLRLDLPDGRWRVELAGEPARSYDAALSVMAERGILRIRAEMDLERYVAAVVASETAPGTPPAALEAQAVVVRSYGVAARDRHAGGALCDLAHCQILRGSGIDRRHRAAAERASRATAGEVLVLPSGDVAEATFHAACGGHTADPREAFGSAASGAAAALDTGCAGPEWRAEIEPALLAAAVQGALARTDPGGASRVAPRLYASDLVLAPGAGGWIARVAAVTGEWRLSGDAFARALDAAISRGKIRSSRLTLSDRGGRVAVRGVGHGHGVGLCQAGAARRAAAGEDRRAILGRYFGARLGEIRREREVPRARGE